MTDEELWAARKECARRWAQAGAARGYPALAAEDENEATLAAEPPKKDERKAKASEG
jgi:hypothetical protein